MASNPARISDCAHSAGERAILEAAVRLFSKKGFNGVSMRSVAEEAGVSKSNIYHHFESKEALYLAIWQHSAESLAELVRNLADGAGEFEERLREFARAHLLQLFENATTMRLLLREIFFGVAQQEHGMFQRAVGDILESLIGIFENGRRAGLLRPGVDPSLCALLLLGSDNFYFLSHDLRQQPPLSKYDKPPEQFSSGMMDIILRGMLADTQAMSATS